MKLIYIVNARIPTEKAHGLQIMKMCEAFVINGAEVELVVPRRLNVEKGDPFDFYGIKHRFKITRLFTLDVVRFGPLGFLLQSFTFSCSAFFYALFRSAGKVIFSRDIFPTLWLAWLGKKTVYEMHDFPQSGLLLSRILCRGVEKVVTTSRWSRDLSLKEFSLRPEKILCYPNGVDVSDFDIDLTKEEARKRVGLENFQKIVMYSGHLYEWKGVGVLAESVEYLPSDVSIVFVGGTVSDTADFKKKYASGRILVIGHRPYTEIPVYLKAADVLVVPNIPSTPHSTYSTSPIKLFEYLVSQRPIVASDLPSLRELLSESSACLVPAGNPRFLAEGVARVLGNLDLAANISRQAYTDVQKWSWTKRASAILDFIR